MFLQEVREKINFLMKIALVHRHNIISRGYVPRLPKTKPKKVPLQKKNKQKKPDVIA
jgi:hypothetical protein